MTGLNVAMLYQRHDGTPMTSRAEQRLAPSPPLGVPADNYRETDIVVLSLRSDSISHLDIVAQCDAEAVYVLDDTGYAGIVSRNPQFKQSYEMIPSLDFS